MMNAGPGFYTSSYEDARRFLARNSVMSALCLAYLQNLFFCEKSGPSQYDGYSSILLHALASLFPSILGSSMVVEPVFVESSEFGFRGHLSCCSCSNTVTKHSRKESVISNFSKLLETLLSASLRFSISH